MTDQTLPLITFYQGWQNYQQGLVEVITPLSPEQLALPAASHSWTIGMLAQHIVGNRAWWFHMWMGEGSSDFAHIASWDPQDPQKQFMLNAAELVVGLNSTWQMIQDSLTRCTAADLGQVFSPPAVMSEEEQEMFGNLTRKWIIWHVLEHEIHHGGELSLALGAHGIPGIYGGI